MGPLLTAGVLVAGAKALPKTMNATDKLFNTVNNIFGGKAREIRQIAKAESEAMITTAETEAKVAMIKAQGAEAVAEYVLAKESQKMQNTLNVVNKAELLISPTDTAIEEPVNQDWITRFFSIAEDISDETLQNLWAQILSGEVKQPKSYSLRTLDVLKNMTQDDAQLLVKASKYLITHNKNLCTEKYCLPLLDVVKLGEMGIVNSNDLQYNMTIPANGIKTVDIASCIVLEGHNTNANEIKVKLNVKALTIAGQELLKLVPPQDADSDFIKNIAMSLKAKNKCSKVTKHVILKHLADGRLEYQTNGIEI